MAKIERLQAIVDQLPKTIDNVRIVPGMEVWILPDTAWMSGKARCYSRTSRLVQVICVGTEQVICQSSDGLQPIVTPDRLASSREAAEAGEG